MRRRLKRICAWPDCGEAFELVSGASRVDSSYCELHRTQPSLRDRRRADPETDRQRQRIYSNRRWKITRKIVLNRDNYMCVICGATELEQRLVVDHIHGVLNVPDPYDPDECQTLCLICSGRKDGARGASNRTASHPHPAFQVLPRVTDGQGEGFM